MNDPEEYDRRISGNLASGLVGIIVHVLNVVTFYAASNWNEWATAPLAFAAYCFGFAWVGRLCCYVLDNPNPNLRFRNLDILDILMVGLVFVSVILWHSYKSALLAHGAIQIAILLMFVRVWKQIDTKDPRTYFREPVSSTRCWILWGSAYVCAAVAAYFHADVSVWLAMYLATTAILHLSIIALYEMAKNPPATVSPSG